MDVALFALGWPKNWLSLEILALGFGSHLVMPVSLQPTDTEAPMLHGRPSGSFPGVAMQEE